LDAEVYPQERVANFINDRFVPVKIHIKERPQDFGRFKAEWTPTLILAEPDGTERHRLVGYLPADDFLAQIELGLAKAAFGRGQFDQARTAFLAIAEKYPKTDAAPEAVYWAAVSGYKASGNPEFLKKAGEQLRDKWPNGEWAKKSSVWVS
jgi:tetratricopeptide (TPR) repeat protein